VDGEGVVVRQAPAAGTALAVGETCSVTLGAMETLLEAERRARKAADDQDAALVAAAQRPAPARAGARRRR